MSKLILAAAAIGLAVAAGAQTPPAPAADDAAFETWAAHARERLMALDTNHDGKISKDEFAARAAMSGHHQEGGSDAARPDGPKHGGARMFDRADTNQDGVLDATEINAMLAHRFARMDANHDGVLTPDERHAMRGGTAPEQ